MSTTIVHLVRHGEVHNPTKILYGRLPGFRLSARGQSQAARTAQSFTGHDVTALFASPLQRAQETAQPFAKVTGCEVTTLDGVIESANRFEGLRTKGWRSQLFNPVRWRYMTNPTVPSWGEPYEDILARMLDAVEKARKEAEGHEAIVVSHQLPIVMVQRYCQGLALPHSPLDRQCDLASVSSLVFKDDQLIDWVYSEPGSDA